jgi:hypothetical protein
MNRMREQKQEPAEKPEKASAPVRPALPIPVINLLNGSWLTRENVLGNMKFILFCAGMMILYIAYGYHTERTVRELDRTGSELKELRSEYITIRARLEKLEQQSQVAAGISALGLEESRVPPVKIEVDPRELDETRTP